MPARNTLTLGTDRALYVGEIPATGWHCHASPVLLMGLSGRFALHWGAGLVETCHSALVDAGVDAQVLRQRWPNRQRQVLLAGSIEPYHHGAEAGYGATIRLQNDRLSVPHAYRALARGWEHGHEQTGFKAQVEVAFGRRHEPWVLGIRQ
mgnify:CR=1 FL=1